MEQQETSAGSTEMGAQNPTIGETQQNAGVGNNENANTTTTTPSVEACIKQEDGQVHNPVNDESQTAPQQQHSHPGQMIAENAPTQPSFPWPAPVTANTTASEATTTTPEVMPQALQVNAGSQQAQQGFLLPSVNQLPMPASLGIPGVFPGAPATATAPMAAPSFAPPSVAAASIGAAPAFNNDNPTSAAAIVPTNGVHHPSDGSNGVKRLAAGPAFGAPDQKNLKLEPSVVSSYSSEKFPTAVLSDAELEKLAPAERRRYERNMREQQRSYRISQQIKLLRDILEENKIPFKPNKFSILVSIVEYIKQLQARSFMLDSEHQRLLDTIRQTNEMVTNGHVPSSGDESPSDESGKEASLPDFASSELMVKGLDYESVFDRCPSALGIASLDGRVLSCNSSFEELLAVQKDMILQQSMFMYIRNHQDIFEAMADLLKRSSAATEAGDSPKGSQLLFWCGYVISLQEKKLSFSITLTNTSDGDPKYFSLSAAEMGD